MAHGHQLVSQVGKVQDVALSTLAAGAAFVLNTTFAGETATFLIKRLRFWLQLRGRTAGDDGPLIVFACNGDVNVTEAGVAVLENNTVGPADTTQMLTQDNAWAIYRWSMTRFQSGGLETEQMTPSYWLKAPGRGFPAPEAIGWQVMVFNAGNTALATGITVGGIVEAQGVWLRD